MHGRGRMIIDPRIPTLPGRGTFSFHLPGTKVTQDTDRHKHTRRHRHDKHCLPAISRRHSPFEDPVPPRAFRVHDNLLRHTGCPARQKKTYYIPRHGKVQTSNSASYIPNHRDAACQRMKIVFFFFFLLFVLRVS